MTDTEKLSQALEVVECEYVWAVAYLKVTGDCEDDESLRLLRAGRVATIATILSEGFGYEREDFVRLSAIAEEKKNEILKSPSMAFRNIA